MKKVVFFLSILLLCVALLTGCYNYRDINTVLFTTAMIIDVNENDEPVVYIEAFHSFRSNQTNSEEGQRLFYKGSGKTLFATVRSFNLASNFKINYTQNKALIFTEKAARQGLKKYLDFLQRDQEFLLRPYIIIYRGDVEDLINLKLEEEEYIGLFLYESLGNPVVSSAITYERFNQYLTSRLIGKKNDVIPLIMLDETQPLTKIVTKGGAVLQEDQLVDFLDDKETVIFRFLIDRIQASAIEIPHPDDPEVFLSLEVLKSKTKTKLTYENDEVLLTKTIHLRTTIAESQAPITFDEATLDKIKAEVAIQLDDRAQSLFEKYKRKNIDIFEIQENFHRRYPRAKVENAIEITNLRVEVEHYIEGSTDIVNFK